MLTTSLRYSSAIDYELAISVIGFLFDPPGDSGKPGYQQVSATLDLDLESSLPLFYILLEGIIDLNNEGRG